MLLETYSTNTTENMICSKALIDDQRRKAREEEERRQIHRNKQRMEMDRFLMELETAAGQILARRRPGLGTSRLTGRNKIRAFPLGNRRDSSGQAAADWCSDQQFPFISGAADWQEERFLISCYGVGGQLGPSVVCPLLCLGRVTLR